MRTKLLTTLALSLIIGTASAQSLTAQQAPELPAYKNTRLTAYERAKDLCSRLTLEEKTMLMMDRSPEIARLGIPEFHWWNEALHGVGRNGFATVFPITVGMAASFDDALLYRVFTAVSDEARAKNTLARHSGATNRYQGLSFWTPNINIFRDPRWGRGQETYGEDPYLTTRMGLAVVAGLQGDGRLKIKDEKLKMKAGTQYRKLLACAKHFAVHSGPEWNRHEFNIEKLPERDLWETYLPAFKALVQEGHVAEVMCAYQSIDKEPCCGNTRYLQSILRGQWGFRGIVTSDCSAVNDFWMPGRHGFVKTQHEAAAKAVRAGTDVECGSQYASLPEALAAGEITEAEIDTSLIRLLTARFELGDMDPDEMNPWTKIPMSVVACKEHKQLALQMAHESIVLLKNDGTLPLALPRTAEEARDIVVMGPNANDSIMQWGNYSGYPTATSTILQGISERVPGVRYIQGCGLTRNEVSESRYADIVSPDGQRGMKADYWNNPDLKGAPVATTLMGERINLSNGGATVFHPGISLEDFSARYEGIFEPKRSERITLSLAFDDGARLIVNGDTLEEVWKSRARIQHINKEMDVESGKKYHIVVEYYQTKDLGVMQFDIIHKSTPTTEQILANIGEAKTIIFVGGISPSLEGEEMKVSEPGFKGGDRTDIQLPQAQRDVIAMLRQAGKRVIFVNCSGSAVAMVPETQNASAIVQAWYPGEQGGRAVADVLFGDYNPSGKLPITFYREVGDLPDFLDYRMDNRTYRYFRGNPLFEFGYGLSYTTFKVQPKEIKNGKAIIEVKNTGRREGTETVQLYIRKVNGFREAPEQTAKNGNGDPLIKTLRGYQRITLKAGETGIVEIPVNKKTLETWDEATQTMRFTPGTYEIMIGTSSRRQDLVVSTLDIGK